MSEENYQKIKLLKIIYGFRMAANNTVVIVPGQAHAGGHGGIRIRLL